MADVCTRLAPPRSLDFDSVSTLPHFAEDQGSAPPISERIGPGNPQAGLHREGNATLQAQIDGVMEVVPVGIWICRDAGCTVIERNAEARRQLRLSSNRPNDSRQYEVWIDGQPVAPHDRPMQVSAREGRTYSDVEEEIRFDDGTSVRLRVNCVPLFDEHGAPAGMVASSIDLSSPGTRRAVEDLHAEGDSRRVSDLRETYDRVRDFERMALTGVIASGLGHDLGNLLLPLRLRLDALRRIALPEEAKSDIAAIETAVNYLQQLSTGLRWLAANSGTGTEAAARTRLHVWIRDAEQTLRDSLPPAVIFTINIPTGLPAVRISQVALTQAVYNLVQNAGQALRDRTDAQVELSADLAPSGHAVRISVRDNGPGLDEEGLDRCFEPFFSTKKRQISTGLGLAIVQSLARRAGGDAIVSSEMGTGATFTITLPVARADVDTSIPAEESRAIITVRGDRRQALVRTILTHDGFAVVGVGDAGGVTRGVWVSDLEEPGTLEALRSFVESRPQRWALVIGRPDEQFNHLRILNAGAFEDIPAFREALEYMPQPEPSPDGRANADDR